MIEAYSLPGREGRQPEVRIHKATVQVLGEPTVDYAKLDSLLREELGVPYEKIPRVTLGGTARWGLSGIHIPYTQSIYINAARCASKGQERLDEELLRQSHYLSQSTKRPLLTGALLLPYTLTTSGGLIVGNELKFIEELIPDTWTTVKSTLRAVDPIVSTVGGTLLYHRFLDLRRSAADDFADDVEVRDHYKDIIVFPNIQ